ncbi:Protein of unknown function [Cotesia congregata]|uniref:Uncharacterized protein n=1 Tax=Cotesia congregata TaxID=51543 RepID=A0A8J2HFD2_COTCN|nr:Protein of unknown function [Cotesia congregata]
MLDEDFCPCSSPDLWKEALDCQDLTETQALDDIIQENSDNELVEETRFYLFLFICSDDDVVPNSHNNSKAKSPSKSTSPSTSIRSSQLVTPVQVERKISQVLRQEYASRNRASNNKNEYIISESSESDSDSSIDKRPLQSPSVRNEANSEINVNSSDSETGGFDEAQTVSAKSASQSLKEKGNLAHNSAVDDSSDDSFNEAQTLSAKSASQSLRDKENLKNNSLVDNKPSVSKPAGQSASSSNDIQNNNPDLDDEIQQWLEENNNEIQWVKPRNDL